MFHLQPPSSPPTPPRLLSPPWSRSRRWVGYSTVYNISNSLSSVWLGRLSAFSLAITGLQGFSNGAFEEITLFSPSSREKTETFGQQLIQSITQTELKLCLTHLATKISSYLVCVEAYRRTHIHFLVLSLESVRNVLSLMCCNGIWRFDAKTANCFNFVSKHFKCRSSSAN